MNLLFPVIRAERWYIISIHRKWEGGNNNHAHCWIWHSSPLICLHMTAVRLVISERDFTDHIAALITDGRPDGLDILVNSLVSVSRSHCQHIFERQEAPGREFLRPLIRATRVWREWVGFTNQLSLPCVRVLSVNKNISLSDWSVFTSDFYPALHRARKFCNLYI